MFEDAIDSLCYEAAFSWEALENPEVDLDELSDVSDELSETFRTLAISLLLARANSDGFYHNLIRSGRARTAFLERAATEQRRDHPDAGSGRFQPLLDAIAADDLDGARQMATGCRSDFVAGAEYEDDWCYGRLLGWMVDPGAPEPDARPLLERFLAFLDGKPTGRWLMCRALVYRDQAGLEEGMMRLLEDRDREIAEDEERGQIEDVAVMARRHVFIEGLAVLRLATQRGLTTEIDYPGCPSLARIQMVQPFPGE